MTERNRSAGPAVFTVWLLVAIILIVGVSRSSSAAATDADPRSLLQAVVMVKAHIPALARTAPSLGTERQGSGIVIDDGGLILTIGYLLLEAGRIEVETADGGTFPAEFIAYDTVNGFGLLRGLAGFKVPPVKLGHSFSLKLGDKVLALAYGGPSASLSTVIVGKREFPTHWEFLLDEALFTAPAHPLFAGAALLNPAGELVGIGALAVADALPGSGIMGTLFVPVDALRPVLGDLIAFGRNPGPPRPWLGITSREEYGRLFIDNVMPDGPAAKVGLQSGDLIVGVGGQAVKGLGDFYRKVWALGHAGVRVPINVLRGNKIETVVVTSGDRHRFLRLKSSL